MLYFECDYNNGCHPAVLKALADSNSTYMPGYGDDELSRSAREKIRTAFDCPDADIYFLAGGTQSNAVVISSLLKPYEGVVAVESAHIATHESGAIELSGHKVLALKGVDGKLSADTLKAYLKTYYADGNYEHMVFPGMVYISFPTELGTIYSRSELEQLHAVCQEYSIPLFIDGARLGYGLMSRGCDIPVKDFAGLCDVFYVGGTKVGALCGEAVVFPRNNAPRHFFSMVKQRGALFAKGRLCGAQFDALFTDGLYFEISRNAIDTAETLKQILKEKGFSFYLETVTNQQFVIAENSILPALSEKVRYAYTDRYDDGHTVIRFCTSWCTSGADLEALREAL